MKNIEHMLPYLFVTALTFYLFPLFGVDTGSFMTILLIVVPLLCFVISLLYGAKWGFDLLYSIIVAIMFIPSIYIYYNSSAWIYVFIYPSITLAGSAVGDCAINQKR